MRTITPWLGALLVAVAATSTVSAGNDCWVYPRPPAPACGPCCPPPCAPDACGCGWYNTSPGGMVYGPNHNVYPGFMPFNGILPDTRPPAPAAGPPTFMTHPYVRSPRDYFMYENR